MTGWFAYLFIEEMRQAKPEATVITSAKAKAKAQAGKEYARES